MNGDQVNRLFENSIIFSAKAKHLTTGVGLQNPSDLNATIGVANSVTEQFHQVELIWDNANCYKLIIGTNSSHWYKLVCSSGIGTLELILMGFQNTFLAHIGSASELLTRNYNGFAQNIDPNIFVSSGP